MDHAPSIICLAEPMVWPNKFPKAMMHGIGFSVNFIHNHRKDKPPNLWVMWRREVKTPTIIMTFEQQITMAMEMDGVMHLLIFVHAESLKAKQRNLWYDIASMRNPRSPWMIVEDFNCCLY
ncbi:hypothetical protein NE237_025002 [Protea cynaroides]|uniref:Uncharacterized protein n=1 Tax=Protea cynaroides TaxID=273540 RepID=A0A9Q0H100_9MAGN|nr:hypothetical protein NE237_025002 [Protea cynaroides]